jgi:pimeloyl-ACP methyl ester carboxylesterase
MAVATEQRTRLSDVEAEARASLLEGIRARDLHTEAAGIRTAGLQGGAGEPIVLLHGPGESAVKWLTVLPDLVESNAIVAPDLPAHGGSEVPEPALDLDRAVDWLGGLIERTCERPPVLVGHVLGGAIAARFAARHSDRIATLVLVDSLGLARFRPSPRFAATLFRFLARPSERSYDRFMRQCAFDLDDLRTQMGKRWGPFVSYNLALARSPSAKAAGRVLRRVGIPRIPTAELKRIKAPTHLVWGRQDRANRLKVAEAASESYGWPLHVIEDCADDPPRDRPDAFLRALRAAAGSRP